MARGGFCLTATSEYSTVVHVHLRGVGVAEEVGLLESPAERVAGVARHTVQVGNGKFIGQLFPSKGTHRVSASQV